MVKVAVDQKENNDQSKVNKKSFKVKTFLPTEEVTVGGIREIIKELKDRISKEND